MLVLPKMEKNIENYKHGKKKYYRDKIFWQKKIDNVWGVGIFEGKLFGTIILRKKPGENWILVLVVAINFQERKIFWSRSSEVKLECKSLAHEPIAILEC